MDNVLIEVRDARKDFHVGKITVQALRGLDLEVQKGDFLAIVGPSGSGKTTLLNLIGALDVATSGDVLVFGEDLSSLSRRDRADLRLHSLGFVFQAYNLVPVLTALENVEFVLELQGADSGRRATAMEVLENLSLGDLADRRPNELSGGQQQRVAVARAVASRPRLVLADEPTANLDSENSEALLRMMRGLRDDEDMTFVFSTHDPLVMSYASRVVTLRDGRVVSDERRNSGGEAPNQGGASAHGGAPAQGGPDPPGDHRARPSRGGCGSGREDSA
jgi:putative ABC transport system ATP-binding protein